MKRLIAVALTVVVVSACSGTTPTTPTTTTPPVVVVPLVPPAPPLPPSIGTLQVILRAPGVSLEGVVVAVDDTQRVSDPQGVLMFPNIPFGNRQVTASRVDFVPISRVVELHQSFLVVELPLAPIVLGVSSISIEGPASVAVGSSVQYRAVALLDNDSTRDLTEVAVWSSSAPPFATVSRGGVVTGIKVPDPGYDQPQINSEIAGVLGARRITITP